MATVLREPPRMPPLSEVRIQKLLAKQMFPVTRHLVIPNVSYGFLPYEADLIAVTKAGYAHEVEIKISRADILNENHKQTKIAHHGGSRCRISYFWFAGPADLREAFEAQAPEHWGIITFDPVYHHLKVERPAKKMRGGPIGMKFCG